MKKFLKSLFLLPLTLLVACGDDDAAERAQNIKINQMVVMYSMDNRNVPIMQQDIAFLSEMVKPCWDQFRNGGRTSVKVSFMLLPYIDLTDENIHYVAGDSGYGFASARTAVKQCLNRNTTIPQNLYNKRIEMNFETFDMNTYPSQPQMNPVPNPQYYQYR